MAKRGSKPPLQLLFRPHANKPGFRIAVVFPRLIDNSKVSRLVGFWIRQHSVRFVREQVEVRALNAHDEFQPPFPRLRLSVFYFHSDAKLN